MTQPRARNAATPTLIYWLLVICGLTGLALQRIDVKNASDQLIPLWIGTIGGVAVGQIIAKLRVRLWVLIAVGAALAWFSPLFFFILYAAIRGPAETLVFAFIPALIGGYLSLSERGALVAFWYPAVLWMLVILDGPSKNGLDASAALPFVIGLAALFVAFLRARETRRAALWREHATARLAVPVTRAVLRASPVREASQIAWTGFAGASALVLTAWIAPHLWQKDETNEKHAHVAVTEAAKSWSDGSYGNGTSEPCCLAAAITEEKRSRVREYLPLLHDEESGTKTIDLGGAASCHVCENGSGSGSGSGSASGGGRGSGGGSGSGGWSGSWNGGGSASWSGSGGAPEPWNGPQVVLPNSGTVVETTPDVVSPFVAPEPLAPAVGSPVHVNPKPIATPPVIKTGAAPKTVGGAAIGTTSAPVVIEPTRPAHKAPAPWRGALFFCVSAFGIHILVRAVRRRLLLRHLERPFWSETLDQRISNHWQRMLIGLYDAGIQPGPEEQPHELARRVGIAGMDTCATILERVRHGVRVDADDLDSMHSAAGSVFRAARAKAGTLGRAASWLRWPIA